MKIIGLFILFLLSTSCLSYGQLTGINFQPAAWKQILRQADEEGKLIFVDVYTSWCGPCKVLDREVFADTTVGRVFSRRFINLKLDAERGEGIDLAKAYHVSAYPTLLFINSSGQLVHEVIGLVSASQLIAQSNLALTKRGGTAALPFTGNQPPKSLTDYEQAYAQHQTDTSFLYSYIQLRQANNVQDNNKLLDRYIGLLSPAQRHSRNTLVLLSTCLETFDSPAGQLLAANIHQADKLEGQGYSMGRTFGFARATFERAVAKRDTHILGVYNRIIPVLNKMYSPYTMQDEADSLSLLAANRLRYLKETQDTTQYLQLVPAYVQAYLLQPSHQQLAAKDAFVERWFMTPYLTGNEDSTKVPGFANIRKSLYQDRTRSVADHLIEYAAEYSQMGAAPDQLMQALLWSKRAQELIDKPTYILTEASILKQLNRLPEARRRLAAGIAQAKSRQEDSRQLEDTLAEYKR